jgi:hypothetical protein
VSATSDKEPAEQVFTVAPQTPSTGAASQVKVEELQP